MRRYKEYQNAQLLEKIARYTLDPKPWTRNSTPKPSNLNSNL